MLHVRFSGDYEEFRPDDELVVDPEDPESFLLLRKRPVRYAQVLGALNSGHAELVGSAVPTSSLRLLFNLLPHRRRRPPDRLHLVK